MKAKTIFTLILGAGLFATSCSDFLTEDAKGKLSDANAMRTESDVIGSINALYNKVCGASNTAHHFAYAWFGDDITAITTGNKEIFREFDTYNVNSSSKNVRMIWKDNYSIIKAANFIIEGSAKSSVRSEILNKALGQAYYWRAYTYFRLVRAFGEIPLITKTEIDYNVEKSSIAKVYELIESDLNKALELVPEKFTAEPEIINGLNSFANKGTVQATLSAVYMAHAGYPLNGGAEYYKKAADMAKAVIIGSQNGTYYYRLEPTFADKFKYVTNNDSKEMVLAIRYNNKNDEYPWGWGALSNWTPLTQLFDSNELGGWNDLIATYNYYVNFPEGARKEAIYGNDGGKILLNNGKKYNWYDEVLDDQTKKMKPVFPQFHPMFRNMLLGKNGDNIVDYNSDMQAATNGLSSQNLRIISYDEVLLWYAESIARTGQADELAKECLRKVIDRAYVNNANKPNVTTLAANPEEFANQCLKEHGYEVTGYYPALVTRGSDQLRMNQLKENYANRVANVPVRITNNISLKEQVTIQNSKSWDDAMNYAPIFHEDAVLNNNLNK